MDGDVKPAVPAGEKPLGGCAVPGAGAVTRDVGRAPAAAPCDALSPEFNMFHMVAVGLSSSILGCLLTLLVYTYCQRYQQQAHDATVIHPVAPAPLNTSITNHINKLDKYDSVEAIKVRHAQRPPQPAREEGGWPRGRPAKRGAGRGAGGGVGTR